jgi:hypothetical protein
MSILETRAPALPKLWSLPHTVFSTISRYAGYVLEAIEEAHRLRNEAARKYPSIRW